MFLMLNGQNPLQYLPNIGRFLTVSRTNIKEDFLAQALFEISVKAERISRSGVM